MYTTTHSSTGSIQREMATIAEDVCDISDGSYQSDSIVRETTAGLQHQDSGQQTLSPTRSHPAVGIWNGSLPVAVPVGPGFHHVESSTTDSGVSNTSSVASDCVPMPNLVAEEISVTPDMHLELIKVERALRSRGSGGGSTEESRECESTSVSGLPETGGELKRKEDELADGTSRLDRINIEGTRSGMFFKCGVYTGVYIL